MKIFLSVSLYSLGTAQDIVLPIHPIIEAIESIIPILMRDSFNYRDRFQETGESFKKINDYLERYEVIGKINDSNRGIKKQLNVI